MRTQIKALERGKIILLILQFKNTRMAVTTIRNIRTALPENYNNIVSEINGN
jgi:hypothetical protein